MRSVKIKIRNLAVLFFSLFLTLAVFSQISAANPKPTYDVGLNKADWLYYKTNNDLSAYLGKKSSNLPTVRYQKGGDYLEFSMTGVSPNDIGSRLENASVSLETNVKQPNTPTLFYRNILKDIDATYQITNIPFKIKEEIILKKVLGVSELGSNLNSQANSYKLTPTSFFFSAETSAKPVKQDDGSIAFFGENGEYLFQLDKPFMVDGKGIISNDVSIEIKPTSDVGLRRTNKTKTASEETIFGDSNLERKSGLSPVINKYTGIKTFVNGLYNKYVNNKKVLDLGGIEPPDSQVTNRSPHQVRPRTGLFYHKENSNQNRQAMSVLGPQKYVITLSADSDWLSTATYPVIIDPTVTHSADAQFNGQKNRVSDSNSSTDAVQLESSYPEATKDPYTVLLLHFNEANGTTAGIRDYASTTRVITANGNASTTSSVTQLGLGNSAAFDGTGDYFSMPDSDDWNFGSGDFSIDFWFKTTTSFNIVGQWGSSNNQRSWGVSLSTGKLSSFFDSDGTGADFSLTGSIVINDGVWHHVAVIRSGNTFTLYVDGTVDGTTSSAISLFNSTDANLIGAANASAPESFFNGYLDSLRIIKGRALTPEEIKAAASRRPYSVYTSPVVDATASVTWNTVNWTEGGVNTGNGEQPYSTNSLVAQWDFNDTSGTTLTASSSGSCTTACNGTLTNFAYTASQDQATTTTGWTANNKKWGAGGLMMESVASADYVSIADPASNVLDPNSADLTIETWIKTSDTSAEIFSNNNANGTACTSNGYYLGIDANGYPVFYLDTNGATAGCDASTTSQFKINDGGWHKVAVSVTRGTSAVIYVDGKSAGSDTSVTSYSAITVTGNVFWGGSAGGLDAILDSARFYSRALSASEILSNYNAGNIEIQTRTGATSDPNDGSWEAWKPTTGETQLLSMDSDKGNWNAPEQIDGYTKLLLHMDGADAATTFPNSATTTHTVTANGNAQVDTAQSKFRGASGLFDGTGDYLSVPDSNDWDFGTGNFTVDTWVQFNSLAKARLIGNFQSGTGGWFITYYNNEKLLEFYSNNGTADWSYSVSWTPSVATWYHIAVVRSGNNLYFFVNGTQVGATQDVTGKNVNNSTSVLRIADEAAYTFPLNGWLDELRISKGIARWTSNFTPPPRAYGSNVKADNETTLKQEGTASTKFTIGAPQVDGNTVALWHFEETGTTTGTYLYDETANNNDATTTGTTVVDGIFGKARKFNGTSDTLSIADSSNFDIGLSNEPFTIEAFVKTTDTDGNIISRGGGASAWNSTNGQQYHLTSYGTSVRLYWWTGATWADVVSNEAITTGRWTHIVVTYNGTITRIFINGVAQTDTETAVYAKPSSSNLTKIGLIVSNEAPINGTIDEVRIIKGRALSADEIAEAYRMGANHHLTRQVSAVDLSGANKLAFNVASDRPGTYLETMLGESDYANYELASSTLALSTNTVLYIKGDEIASSTSLKDSSFSGKAITANGNARTAGGGKIGNSVYFDGTGDYVSIPGNNDFYFTNTGSLSIDFWVKLNATNRSHGLIGGTTWSGSADTDWMIDWLDSNQLRFQKYSSGPTASIPQDTNWHHIAVIGIGGSFTLYFDGISVATSNISSSWGSQSTNLLIGTGGAHFNNVDSLYLNGYLDELRIIKGTALSADQIRQAYEYGLRSHQITIDFGATLQTSDLISSATDYNFSLTATTSGLSATTSGLYLGDTIIVKENVGGTESVAQGTVKSINSSTGAVTVPSWDTGSTFPSGNGYSPNATVFKWQREYFDLTGAATTTRNAITNLTLRPTNGAEGRTIYLDDFRYNTNYLTASSSSAITSGNNRYLQYRAIFTSTDTYVSPFLSAFNTLYTALANSFPAIIGISGGGFLSF